MLLPTETTCILYLYSSYIVFASHDGSIRVFDTIKNTIVSQNSESDNHRGEIIAMINLDNLHSE